MATSQAAPRGSSDGVPRRRFLGLLLGFSVVSLGAMVAAPIVAFLLPPKSTGAAGGGKTLVGTVADGATATLDISALVTTNGLISNTATVDQLDQIDADAKRDRKRNIGIAHV